MDVRSSELARLAGVSVRALRHYHQIGVLAEPERSANGYRRYDVHDLVHLLRIKRLASLGIPLERMPGLLDEPDGDVTTLLDELDRELAGQIDRLNEQRGLIARLRDLRAPPDLPPELAPFLAAFAAAGVTSELARFDREQTVLLAHAVGEEGMPHLADFYERISHPDLVAAVATLSERFSRLTPESGDHEVEELAADFMDAFGPVLADFAAGDPPIDFGPSGHLLGEYTDELLNDQQRQMLAHIEARLTQLERP